MHLQKAQRKKAKIKLGLQGPSGSGKTFGALLIAYGLCGDWNKIAVIDTENSSADLYDHLGSYNVLPLEAPFSPEKYIEAIRCCIKEGMEVIVVDSISHEWQGAGGILETHSQMTGNSFTAWAKLTPRHNAFVQEILQSPVHIIGNIRVKQDYVLSDKNGKVVPEKVGLKGITREGLDYEFTLVFDLDMMHNVVVSKDRTSLFIDKPAFRISTAIGKQIQLWCNSGLEIDSEAILRRIEASKSIGELLRLYKMSPQITSELKPQFEARKRELLNEGKTLINIKNSQNGTN
jgi:AAA domain